MYSSTEATSRNKVSELVRCFFVIISYTNRKRAALEQLRLGKTLGHNSSSVPVVPPRHSPYASTPPPSRDSAVSSRFFPVTPSENPIVLVPNSSPLPSDPQPLPYYPHSEIPIHDVHSLQPSRPPNVSWIHPQWNHTLDPLSAPTGFVFNASANASFRNGRFGTESASSSVIERDEGPPRKRQNRGPLEDAFDGTDVLSSPEIRRATQRRRIVSGGTDIQSVASDDSLPEGLAISGSSTSRLTKMPATPSPGSSSATGTVTDEAKFIRFKFSMPQYTSDRIQAAWVQANGDEKMATALLGDPNWAPASPSNKSQQEAMGRVQELDEESRARRAAAKEKGKKSMIYANRSNLENNTLIVSTPPASKRPLEISPLSPETPIIRPQRKRLKKMVVDSDTEASESDNDARNGRSRLGTSDEMRALNYLNTASPEALQELTGKHILLC
jgi:SWI/SNF-related matrix-associated actin-dependent regulator 1 of chromatin subfamily A